MTWFAFMGGSRARPPYQLERDIEDSLEAANAAIDAEHDDQGRHKAIACDSIGSRSGELVELVDGIRILNGPWVLEENDPAAGAAVIRPSQITANQNDYAPEGIAAAVVLEIESDAARNITGILYAEPRARRFLRVVNRGNFTITFKSNSGSSTSGYRLFFGGSDYLLFSGAFVDLYYDVGSGIWRGPQPAVKQVRTAFSQSCNFTAGGGSTQNFTLSTTLADYTKATVVRFSNETDDQWSAGSHQAKLTSNTNLQIKGASGAEKNFRADIIEWQNLDA